MHSRSGSLSAARTNRAVNWDYREKSFGDVPGVKVGDTWNSRSECLKARVHRASWGGIHGWESFGADSIVLSGGYSDDIDEGETIVYTGSGSRENWRENEQTCDQSFENRFNKALVTSCNRKKPVRVIRGSSLDSKYAPESNAREPIYRYDGLYTVTEYWVESGKDGYQVCKFRLQRMPGQPPLPHKACLDEFAEFLGSNPPNNMADIIRQPSEIIDLCDNSDDSDEIEFLD
ncbi:hypothetical protein AcW1_008728 [Taiwanofungus camphoratus]|nr:hypothetical protein AcV5_006746 [Antrodia cinnamomea]KAI0949009.1 hypothetical protein AcW1_008728 [Antrodia cinnamomea]